jgi:hypothetical protein
MQGKYVFVAVKTKTTTAPVVLEQYKTARLDVFHCILPFQPARKGKW